MRAYILIAPNKKPIFSSLTRSKEAIIAAAEKSNGAGAAGSSTHEVSAIAHNATLTTSTHILSKPHTHNHVAFGYVMKGGNSGREVIPASFRESAQETRLAAGEGRVYKAALLIHHAL